jgi:hypothetical protein
VAFSIDLSNLVPLDPDTLDVWGTSLNGHLTEIAAGVNENDGRITALEDAGTPGSTPTGDAGGDLTGTYPDPTLINSGVTSGVYGGGSSIPIITVDAKGRITDVGTASVSGTSDPDALQKASNLSDLTSASTARTNLGLGTAAVKNLAIGTTAPSSPATNDLWVDLS